MTIDANKDTFVKFFLFEFPRLRPAILGQAKFLGRLINMVELQAAYASILSALLTLSSLVGNCLLLQTSAMRHHIFDDFCGFFFARLRPTPFSLRTE